MRFSDRLKMFEGQYMFAKWVGGNEYVKLVHVGEDFFEFNIINADTMEYQETTMIQKDIIALKYILMDIADQCPNALDIIDSQI